MLPWCHNHHIPVMAYSPVEQGRLVRNHKLIEIAAARKATPAQIALAWLLAQPEIIAIPKASQPEHVKENRAAADIALSNGEMAALDSAFPRPKQRRPLEML